MEESAGAQYAIQIAVHTLRDRCKTLQQRVAFLEEENVVLRTQCIQNEETNHSLSELEKTQTLLAEVTQQRDQLQERVKMVTTENQDLWMKLGKLINVNKNLNEQFNKINETLNQHTSPPALIRSKTFTQNNPLLKHSPQKNMDLNENLSLELENISLKIMDSFSKQKVELEKMCSEISEMQCSDDITENFGFYLDDDLENDVYEEFNYVLDDLKLLKEEVLKQRNSLYKNLKQLQYLAKLEIPSCKRCDLKELSKLDKSTSTDDIPKLGVDKGTETPHNSPTESKSTPTVNSLPSVDVEKICPICSRNFKKDVKWEDFETHVEDHFIGDVSSFEVL